MARHIRTKKVTVWEEEERIMSQSSYGTNIRYDQWCMFEMARRSGKSGKLHYVLKKTVNGVDYCCVSESPNLND